MNLKNNILYSLKRLQTNKINSFINLSGLILSFGIVSVVLVFILNEFSYNQSFKYKDRVCRVINYNSSDHNYWATTPYIIGETVKENFAEVEMIVHQYNISNAEIKKNEDYFPEPGLLCTESSFFEMFGISIVQGNTTDFDDTDNKVLLSELFARKYFGKKNIIGKLLTIRCKGKEYPMEISGIYKDFPENSSIKASYITGINFAFEHLSNNLISTGDVPNQKEMKESWEGMFFTNYLMLTKGVSVSDFEKKLNNLGSKYTSDKVELSLSIQSLNDIYFNSGKIIDNNSGDLGNLPMLYILGSIGFLIMIIACINYFNLTSAQTITQIKNFAVRKVYGASQKNIAKQMIFEYCFLCLFALPFALILAHYSLPYISNLLGKSYALSINSQFFFSTGILIFISLFTGIFTAGLMLLLFTSIGLNKMLKGDTAHTEKKINLRKAMVVFQIIIFIVLLSSTILIQKQVRFAFSKDLGFVKEGLISIPLVDHNLQVFKQEIANNPNVVAISAGMWLPPCTNKMSISIPKVDSPDEMINLIGLFVDYHFAETMGLKLVLGTDFDEKTNNSGVLINESAVKALGLKEIIGERTAFGPIVGVIKDFNMYSLKEAIQPMIIGINPGMCRQLAVRIRTENISETIKYFEQCWNNTGGTSPFQFKFTDDVLKNIYKTDIRFSKIIGLLSVIAIVIASLGLFGLSLFMNRRRTKEIGIRKTNGAKTHEIMAMLNKDFIKWVAIAFVIACPIAWYAMHKWLENFAYKTELSWWIFALAGAIAMGIALLTVSFQSWRAATRNPVESLRYE